MNKVFLKETQKELGISLHTAICPIGSRISGSLRAGNICVTFPQIMPAHIFINRNVLRDALLQEPEKTEKLLNIQVIDLVKTTPVPTENKKEVEPVVDEPLIEKKEPIIEEPVVEDMPLTVEVIHKDIANSKKEDKLINKPKKGGK